MCGCHLRVGQEATWHGDISPVSCLCGSSVPAPDRRRAGSSALREYERRRQRRREAGRGSRGAHGLSPREVLSWNGGPCSPRPPDPRARQREDRPPRNPTWWRDRDRHQDASRKGPGRPPTACSSRGARCSSSTVASARAWLTTWSTRSNVDCLLLLQRLTGPRHRDRRSKADREGGRPYRPLRPDVVERLWGGDPAGASTGLDGAASAIPEAGVSETRPRKKKQVSDSPAAAAAPGWCQGRRGHLLGRQVTVSW
jgi:hypothetical protein